jgi:hypothetical protein
VSRAKTRRPPTRGTATSGSRTTSTATFLATDEYALVEVDTALPRTPGRAATAPPDLPPAARAAFDDLATATEHALDEQLTTPAQVRRKPAPRPHAPSPPPREPDEPDTSIEVGLAARVDGVALRFGVLEDGPQLAAARDALSDAGYAVAVAVGREGAGRLAEAIRGDAVDALLVAVPGGEPAISAALALEPRRPVVIAAIAGDGLAAVRRAAAAGADLVASPPYSAERLAPIALAAERLAAERAATLRARGSEHMLRARLDELSDPDPRGLQPFEVFQRQLELEIKRARRFEYSLSVALFAVEIAPPPPPAGIRGILRARAGNALIHAIRDIDLATQLDHERFLVLLPYTDLTGATHVARRVIAAVAAGDPVISGGRTFPPRVVGAVAGARPATPISFAKLMKDATRALDQARRDGAELAEQP